MSTTEPFSKREKNHDYCGRQEVPAILISRLLLRMRRMYVASIRLDFHWEWMEKKGFLVAVPAGYEELAEGFESIRNLGIFWMNNNYVIWCLALRGLDSFQI